MNGFDVSLLTIGSNTAGRALARPPCVCPASHFRTSSAAPPGMARVERLTVRLYCRWIKKGTTGNERWGKDEENLDVKIGIGL